jgi:hypothetical protein
VSADAAIGDPGLTLGGDPWYGPTDMQVVTALQLMSLDIFPFGAYDAYGRLKVDPEVTAELQRELHEVLAQPIWRKLFEKLSLFDNPGYEAFALGFKAQPGKIKLLAMRQLEWSSKPASCEQFHKAVAEQMLPQIQEYAGKGYVVKPSWIEALRKILALFGGEGAVDEPVGDLGANASAAGIGWKAALGIVLSLLEIANSIGRKPRVDCCVVWRYPTSLSLPERETPRWHPIETVAAGAAGACAGVLWDRQGRHLWHWTKTTPWPAGYQFTPTQIWRGLYPSGTLAKALPAS